MGRTDTDSALSMAQQPQLLALETFSGDAEAQPTFLLKIFIHNKYESPSPNAGGQKVKTIIFLVNPHSAGLVDIQPSSWGSLPFLEFMAKFGCTWVVQRLRKGPSGPETPVLTVIP